MCLIKESTKGQGAGGKGPAGAKALRAHNEKQRPGKVDLNKPAE